MQIRKLSHHLFISLSIIFASVLLIACNTHVQEVEDNVSVVLDEAERYIEKAKIPYKPETTDTVTMKEDIWLGQDSFKMTGGQPFPVNLEASDALTVSFAEPIDLVDLINDLREMTGLNFSLDELRATDELPTEAFQLNYTGSLSGLLDYISHKYSIWWKHRKGVVSFYKMETRVFTIYALPTESSMSASMSGKPSSSEKGGSLEGATLSLDTKITLTFWKNIESAIKQVMGKQGEMIVDQTAGQITVTAAPFVMQKIAEYVQGINEKMSRQVAISVKVLQVSLENTDSYGLNLNAAFNSEHFSFSTVGAFTPAETAGTLTMGLVSGNWSSADNIIQAISTQGKTSLVTSSSVTTLNNKVAPVQITTQENYVSKTTIEKDSYSSSSGSTSVEMDTDTLNYGFTMEILPRILDNGRLIVLFSMTLTDLLALTTFSSTGVVDNSTSKSSTDADDDDDGETEDTVVQLPKLQTRGFIQEIAMRSGSTLVLTGFETIENKTDTSGVGRNRISILGGQEYTDQKRKVLVILLTPEILVSPLQPETRMENF